MTTWKSHWPQLVEETNSDRNVQLRGILAQLFRELTEEGKVQNSPFDLQGSNGSYPEQKSANNARCVEKYRQKALVLGSSWRSPLGERYVK
jgi:hypothetical protein